MNNKITVGLLILAAFTIIIVVGINKNPQPNCGQYTSQLINLFTFVCDNISNEIDIVRDACNYCFQRATTIANNNQPSLAELNNCANTHLTDTRYEDCISLLEDAASSGTGQCVSGYCRFVRCIRRSNSDLLIAQCYGEAVIDNDAVLESEQVTLVKNITSCILARARCAPINPITGQPQTNRFNTTTYDRWGKAKTNSVPLYNSIQISPQGDLRIVAFPATTTVQNYFCSTVNLQESSWLDYSC